VIPRNNSAAYVVLESHIDQVSFVLAKLLLREGILPELLESFVTQTHRAQFVGVKHSVHLALDLGKYKLILGHHVQGLLLKYRLLVVLD